MGIMDALDRGLIDALPDKKGLKQRSLEKRLGRDAVIPAYNAPPIVKADPHAVHGHWPVIAPGQIVLARPHKLQRCLTAIGLERKCSFDPVIGIGRTAPPERSSGVDGAHLHLLRPQAQSAGDELLCHAW